MKTIMQQLLGCRGNYDIVVQVDAMTGTMTGWHWGIGSNEGNVMTEYVKLFWENAPEGEPLEILYEVDADHERLALRSIYVFANGRTWNIADLYDEAIEITPIPMRTKPSGNLPPTCRSVPAAGKSRT